MLNDTVKQNTADIAVVTETWFRNNTVKLGTIQGYHSYNKIREGRVGGVVSTYNPCNNIKSISSPTDDPETLWLAARPRWLPREISVLVICGIYFPPMASTQETLREHTLKKHFTLS